MSERKENKKMFKVFTSCHRRQKMTEEEDGKKVHGQSFDSRNDWVFVFVFHVDMEV